MSGLGARVALIVGSLAAAGGGWAAAGQLHDDETQSGTALGAIPIYDCPVPGGVAIGAVNVGDELQLIGVTDDRWAVIRHPDDPDRPAWLPLALVATDANAGDLPQLTCGDAANVTETTIAVATTSTSPVTTSSSSTTTTSTTTTTTTLISTTSTVSSDVTPPTVTVTANRPYLYVPPVNSTPACVGQDVLEVTVVVADSTLPLTIRSIEATWTGPSGPGSANLTPIGGNRFSLQVTSNGPSSGELPVTITATGSDGAGNIGAGQLVVQLRKASSFGCG